MSGNTPATFQLKGLPKRLDDFGRPQPHPPLYVDLSNLPKPNPRQEEAIRKAAEAMYAAERRKAGLPEQQATEPPMEEARATVAVQAVYAGLPDELFGKAIHAPVTLPWKRD